jgi:beta-glucosidase-like glycosyl hydrolase
MRSATLGSLVLLTGAAAAAAAAAAAPPQQCSPSAFTPCSSCDLNGGDLPGQPVSKTLSTADECAALCCAAASAGCAAFSLNAGSPGARACYLKASSGWANGSSPGVDSGALPQPPPNVDFPWFNRSLPADARVAALVAAMTVDEQISWLDDASPAIPRLGLPAYSWEAEALHGVSWNGVATVFPSNIAWGASWDPALVAAMGRVIAVEARAKWLAGLGPDGSSAQYGGLSFMTPNVNLFIGPAWGRGQETFGEDPLLAAALGGPLIAALQTDDDGTYGGSNYTKMIAVAKHFLSYHLDSLGTDGQYRLSHSFNITEADIQQTYLPPFAAAVAANVSSIMCEWWQCGVAVRGVCVRRGAAAAAAAAAAATAAPLRQFTAPTPAPTLCARLLLRTAPHTAPAGAYDGANGTNPAWPAPDGGEPWGVPMCLHPDLMERLLRGQLGWRGYVITDEGSITFAGPGYHGYTATVRDAACLALNAGSDLALGGEFGPHLADCLAAGNVTASRIAQASTRTLSAHMALGWFDTLAARARGEPDPVPYNAVTVEGNVSTPAHRALARTAAAEGLVLLKNGRGGSVLPLSPSKLRKLALVGPTATFTGTATSSYLGNYAPCNDGPGGAVPADPRCHVVDLREALGAAAGAHGFTLAYAPGVPVNAVNTSGIAGAVAAAAGADAIVLALGLDTCQETVCSEGEANDRGRGADSVAPGLDFPGSQLDLLRALVAAYPTTPRVLVVLSGGPVSSPWGFSDAASDAVLQAWYPGFEGGAAIADALLGAASPGGRLPVTIVADQSQLPPPTDFVLSTPPGRTHRYYTGAPLYPFGFGLSYANFSYGGLAVTPAALGPGDAGFTVTATVTYTGPAAAGSGFSLPADEVVQLYGSFGGPGASVPRQQLLGFTRLHGLAPGSATPVNITVPRDALALVDVDGATLRVLPGDWTLWLGGGPPAAGAYPGGTAPLRGALTVQ